MKTMKKAMKNNKGFTLVELIIVVAIIALLIAMIAPNLTSFLGTASETTMQANAKTTYTTVNAWLTQQRVKGVAEVDYTGSGNELVLKKDGSDIKAYKGASGTALDPQPTDLIGMFSAGEFKASTVVTVEAKGYSVIKVTWADGSESGVYPK